MELAGKFGGLIAVQLDGIHARPGDGLGDHAGIGIHEEADFRDEGWQFTDDGGGLLRGDVTGRARHKDESQRIRTRRQGGLRVGEIGDTADFDPDRHCGTRVRRDGQGGKCFLIAYRGRCNWRTRSGSLGASTMNDPLSRRRLILGLAASLFTTTLCAADKPKAVIGISVLTLANPFFKDLADSMTAEAKAHGMTTIVTSGEFDAAKQQNQVADFIVRKVDAIVLCPCDSKAVGTTLVQANKAGIPVFTADIASLAKEGKVVGHVATDNFGGGKLAAVALIEALGGKGKVAILDHPEAESVILRTKGFNEELARQKREKGVSIEVVATLPGGAAKDRSMKATEDLLQAHPDLNGIFAINDPSALGAVAALEKAGRSGQVKIVGFDGMPEGKAAIKAGKIYADPIQFPDRIGQIAIQNIVKYLAGDDVSKETLIPTQLYRKADADKDPTLK